MDVDSCPVECSAAQPGSDNLSGYGTPEGERNPVPVKAEESSQDDDKRDGDVNQNEPTNRKLPSRCPNIAEGEVAAEGKQ